MRATAARRPGGRAGSFTIGLDAHTDDPMRNYAVPDHGACPSASDIGALITFFRRSRRVPRLEYVEEDAPRAWPALATAGFTVEHRLPVMTATPATPLMPRSSAGITIRPAGLSLVFLEAEPDEEQIYRRTGFTDATTKIWASIR
jgi:hypothetical protein